MSAKCDNMMSWIRGAELALSYVIPNDRRPEAVKRMRDARGYVKEVRKLAKNSETKALANAYIRLDPRAGNLSKAQGLLADIEDNVNRGRC